MLLIKNSDHHAFIQVAFIFQQDEDLRPLGVLGPFKDYNSYKTSPAS